MLAIPLNRGSSVNLNEGFFSLLQPQYGETGKPELLNDISGFQQLRDAACQAFEPSESALQLLLRINFQYSNLVPRLSGFKSESRVTFKWLDGFRTSKSHISNDLYVDWACFIWNLAALESQLGAKIERTTDEGIKSAYKHFQQAAGYFDYILHDIFPNCTTAPGTLVGLSADGLGMARDLMLAQAQLCFYEKAVREKKVGNMSAAVIAKLGVQTSLLYETVYNACTQEPLKSILDPSWGQIAEFQFGLIRSAAEFWQATAAKEAAESSGTGYGEEVVRLGVSERMLKTVIEKAQKFKLSPALLAPAEAKLHTVIDSKAAAIKANNTVYFDKLPAETALARITPVSMVKPTPVPAYIANEKTFFSVVLPATVNQSRGEFQRQIEALLLKVSTDASAASSEGRTALSDLGLPGSLEAYKAGGMLPDNLWAKIQKIQSYGGKQELLSKFENLEKLFYKSLQIMMGISTTLQREEIADASFRSQYPLWRGQGSIAVVQELRNNLQQMRETFQKAQPNDSFAKQELNDAGFDANLRTFSQSREEVSKLLPKLGTGVADLLDSAVGIDTHVLEQKLMEMVTLIQTREFAVMSIEGISKIDIGGELLKAEINKSDLNSIVSSRIQQAQPYVDEIQKTIARQPILLQEIMSANSAFVSAQSQDPITIGTNRVIQDLEQTSTRYFNLHAQLIAGITFYTNFQSRLAGLQQSADDLSFTQQLQRQEYETNLAQEMARLAQEQQDRELAEKMMAEMNIEAGARPGAGSVAYPDVPAYISPTSAYPGSVSTNQSTPYSQLSTAYSQPNPYSQPPTHSQPPAYYNSQSQPPSQYTMAPGVHYGTPVGGPPPSSQPPLYSNSPPQQANTQQPIQYQYPSTPANFQSPGQYPPQNQVQGQIQGYQYAPAQVMSSSANGDVHAKALRLAEMGFDYNKCVEALSANNGNEDAALNSLLSVNTASGASAASSASNTSTANKQSSPTKKAGLFGVWGSKN